MSDQIRDYIVYVYQDINGRVRYVGKGSSARALSHEDESQNTGLSEWLKKEKFSVQHAGPYSESEALAVETALICVLGDSGHPLFNKNKGNGPKLRPLGLPNEKSYRLADNPLTTSEIGKITRGALIVYVRSFDLTKPNTEALRQAVQGSWQVNMYMKEWQKNRETGPKAIVGVAGSKTRFIVGAFQIDTNRWGAPSDLSNKGKLWRIPLRDENNPDAFLLQGRKIDHIKFGRRRGEHYYWISSEGEVLHPKKP